MLPRTAVTLQFAKSSQLEALADATSIDDSRTERLIRENCRLTNEHWMTLDRRDLYFSGADAVTVGIAQEVAEFSPPAGAQLFFV
jgi:ATP-dependent Clp protease protease subunit